MSEKMSGKQLGKQRASLSLREHFAGLAMEGICASHAHPESSGPDGEHERVAKQAVQFADALLDALCEERP